MPVHGFKRAAETGYLLLAHRVECLSVRIVRRQRIPVSSQITQYDCDGNLALGRIGSIIEQVSRLRQEGRDVVLVTSGAISSGAIRMRKSLTLAKPMNTSMKSGDGDMAVDANGAAAVGQSLLMSMYETLFARYNLTCAQLLLTESDADNVETFSNTCDTATELLQLGTVPIFNDNDAVTVRDVPVVDDATKEVKFDNDMLASRLATALRADLLLVLTDLDGLYAKPVMGSLHGKSASKEPVRMQLYDPEAVIVRSGIDSMRVFGLLSDNGRGEFASRTRLAAEGMQALIDAARLAVNNGVRSAVVTTGHHPLALLRVVRGEDMGTVFVAENSGPMSKL